MDGAGSHYRDGPMTSPLQFRLGHCVSVLLTVRGDRKFVLRLPALLFGLVFCVFTHTTVRARNTTTVVFPTGNSQFDAPAVQAVLNLGDTVWLKATNSAGTPTACNFGSSSLLASL